ncbi:MAG: hypothetical protein P4L41_03950 [Flavipsychrobacter sp.]|nr:hypothetical protein [Flavipsychrobacter sp.]
MENQGSLTDKIRAIVITKQTVVETPAAPVTATKEEMVRELQEKYPSFSKFEIENAFEQLKIDAHLQEEEQEGKEVYVFTEGFILGE